jgi:hypothetical protein
MQFIAITRHTKDFPLPEKLQTILFSSIYIGFLGNKISPESMANVQLINFICQNRRGKNKGTNIFKVFKIH